SARRSSACSKLKLSTRRAWRRSPARRSSSRPISRCKPPSTISRWSACRRSSQLRRHRQWRLTSFPKQPSVGSPTDEPSSAVGNCGHAVAYVQGSYVPIAAVNGRSNKAPLFDHLVSAGEQRRRNLNPKRLRCNQVDDEIELGRLLHRQVARLRPSQNLVNV